MLNANWIHCKDDVGDRVPLYKKNFQIKKSVCSAFLYASARGVYEATLNGKRVGDFILAPGTVRQNANMSISVGTESKALSRPSPFTAICPQCDERMG
jgi:alpha-L-rhamnosidase